MLELTGVVFIMVAITFLQLAQLSALIIVLLALVSVLPDSPGAAVQVHVLLFPAVVPQLMDVESALPLMLEPIGVL